MCVFAHQFGNYDIWLDNGYSGHCSTQGIHYAQPRALNGLNSHNHLIANLLLYIGENRFAYRIYARNECTPIANLPFGLHLISNQIIFTSREYSVLGPNEWVVLNYYRCGNRVHTFRIHVLDFQPFTLRIAFVQACGIHVHFNILNYTP